MKSEGQLLFCKAKSGRSEHYGDKSFCNLNIKQKKTKKQTGITLKAPQ